MQKSETSLSTSVRSNDRVIAAHAQKKIRDITQHDKLMAMVHNWSVLMGVRESPTESVRAVVANFLVNHFHDFSIQDVTLALELAAAGKLNVDPETYQSFSIVYMGRILNAYRLHLAECNRQRERETAPADHRLPDGETDESFYIALIEFIQQRGEFPVGWNWDAVIRHMECSGIMDESDDELIAFKKKWSYIWREKMKAERLMNPGQRYDAASRTLFVKKEYIKYKLKKLKIIDP